MQRGSVTEEEAATTFGSAADRMGHHTYQYWEHGQSGAIFAIRLNRWGQVTGCRGPLLSNEIREERLPWLPYDEDLRDLTWIERHRDNWEPAPFHSKVAC